jgi:hypothetical protein
MGSMSIFHPATSAEWAVAILMAIVFYSFASTLVTAIISCPCQLFDAIHSERQYRHRKKRVCPNTHQHADQMLTPPAAVPPPYPVEEEEEEGHEGVAEDHSDIFDAPISFTEET